jgi:hypothetical protein
MVFHVTDIFLSKLPFKGVIDSVFEAQQLWDKVVEVRDREGSWHDYDVLELEKVGGITRTLAHSFSFCRTPVFGCENIFESQVDYFIGSKLAPTLEAAQIIESGGVSGGSDRVRRKVVPLHLLAVSFANNGEGSAEFQNLVYDAHGLNVLDHAVVFDDNVKAYGHMQVYNHGLELLRKTDYSSGRKSTFDLDWSRHLLLYKGRKNPSICICIRQTILEDLLQTHDPSFKWWLKRRPTRQPRTKPAEKEQQEIESSVCTTNGCVDAVAAGGATTSVDYFDWQRDCDL